MIYEISRAVVFSTNIDISKSTKQGYDQNCKTRDRCLRLLSPTIYQISCVTVFFSSPNMMLKIIEMLGFKMQQTLHMSGSCVSKSNGNAPDQNGDEAFRCLRLLSSMICISCLEVFSSSLNTMLRKLDFQNHLRFTPCLAPVFLNSKVMRTRPKYRGAMRMFASAELRYTYALSCVAVFSLSPYKILKILNSQKNRRFNHVRLLSLNEITYAPKRG